MKNELNLNKDKLLRQNIIKASYSGLLTNFLYNIYEWRSELREKFNISIEKGELGFIYWWIKWGKDNYPKVSIDYGLSREFFNKHVFINYSEKYEFELPPLSELIYISSEFNESILSYNYFNWLFNHGYTNVLDDSCFSKVILKQIKLWLSKYKEYIHPDILIYFCDSFLSEEKDEIYNYQSEFHTKLIDTITNKSMITIFLSNIYFTREDLQNIFDINTLDGQKNLIKWWLTYGVENYPYNIDIDYGLSKKFLQKYVFKNSLQNNKNINNDFLELKKSRNNEALITIYGKHKLDIGIGYDAKLIKKSLEITGVSCKYNDDLNSEVTPINIFTIPAPDALVELTQIEDRYLRYSINILSCPWELPKWPDSLEFLLEYFDFIWVHSDFVYNSIPSKYLNKTVKIQLPVEVHMPENIVNKNKNKFIVLTAFDLASTVTRKNPYASIDAFIKAFDDNKNTALILKISNGDIHENRLSLLKQYVNQHANITIIDKHLKIEELHELYASIDCFISLHRSEGFGRNIAEMMLLKKPVIVTSFSGNMDFTFENNSYLIPFKKLKLNSADYIFSKDQYWADPDVDYASNVLLEIFNNGIEEEKVINAYNLMTEKYTLKNCGKVMYNILKEYYEN
jgi:hypothetical protein